MVTGRFGGGRGRGRWRDPWWAVLDGGGGWVSREIIDSNENEVNC